MIRTWLGRLAALLLVGTSAAWPRAQSSDSAPRLTIITPEENGYVAGLTTLRAAVDPVDAATSVSFFVDGRQLCQLSAPPFECEWEAGRSVDEHQVRVVAALAGGGRIVRTIQTRGLGYSDSIDVNVVQVTVTVTDGRGRFVAGLSQSAFHVFEDGVPQNISHFVSEGAESVPLELIVAVDISGSMAPAMPVLKQAVKTFLGQVPDAHRVTLLGFNDNMFTLTRRTTVSADRMKAVDRLASWGATSLYDTIIRSVDMLGTQPGRKALVVFTDGEDEGSYAAISDVERRLESSDVTLYMIAQGSGLTNETLAGIMQRLATPTGGRALFTKSIAELHGAFSELLDELANQYLLGYPRSDLRRDGSWRRIKVEVDGHPYVRARQGYRAASRP
jgi:VWFA-related protein